MIERPAVVTDEHLEFLDRLRDSGETNMFGAIPYIRCEFAGLSRKAAGDVLAYWMKSFDERYPKEKP